MRKKYIKKGESKSMLPLLTQVGTISFFRSDSLELDI